MSKAKQTAPVQHNQIQEILTKLGITYTCHYLGFSEKGLNGETWENDKFIFKFKRGKVVESFNFNMGVGHRFFRLTGNYELGLYLINKAQYTNSDHKAIKACKSYSKDRFVTNPSLSDLFYSLTLDMQANEMSFSNWCSDFCFDEDSRKAFSYYEQCCQIAKQMYSLFDQATIESFQEILQDY